MNAVASSAPTERAATTASVRERVRRLDLDRAKGLGILLVVVGHLAAKSQPQGNLWFTLLQTALYQFHMPFFMYLSGYVCYLSGAARTQPRAWPLLVRRRTARLLVPFLLFGLALIVGKLIAAKFMHVDNAPASLLDGVIGMAWDTDHSPAISVWYIFVVFVLTIATPPLLWTIKARIWPTLVIAGVIYLLPVPHVLYLDRVARFFLFFSLGGAAADAGKPWLDFIDRSYVAWAAGLVLLLTIALIAFDSFTDSTRLFACGIASIPALHGLVRRSRLSRSDALLTLGMMCFVIYLLNTPFIGLAKGLLLKLLPWDGINFLLFFVVLTLSGIWGPILMKRHLFRHVPAIDRITD